MPSDYLSSGNILDILKARELNRNKASDYLSSGNIFNILKARELNGKTKAILPNTFPEYHLQAFKDPPQTSIVSKIVIAGDIIFVLHREYCLIPYLRHADGEISPLTDDNGSPVIMRSPDIVDFVCYNNYNDSLLIVGGNPFKSFHSIPIALIRAGQTTAYTRYFRSDKILHCDFDIPNCRGMIYNEPEKLFTIFELKEYRKLFTIPDEGGVHSGYLHFRFLSPCNREMVMYNDNSNFSGDISLKIYSKFDGRLRKQISLRLHPQHHISFIALCGKDTLLVQQKEMKMQVINIASDSPEVIKTTEIEAMFFPYYLDKREQFVCYTINNSLHVCNLQGDSLFTFPEIHPSVRLLTGAQNISDFTYITGAQNILISASLEYRGGIDVLNIVTGERLAKIAKDNSHRSRMREAAVKRISALAYDERTREIFTGNIYGICCRWSNRILEDIGDLSIYLLQIQH